MKYTVEMSYTFESKDYKKACEIQRDIELAVEQHYLCVAEITFSEMKEQNLNATF